MSKKSTNKKPAIELTTDEILDRVFAKPLADKLREIAHGKDDDDKTESS